MTEANVSRLAGEFKAVHRELIDKIESSRIEDVNTLVRKRQAIVDRIFDHLHEKTGFKTEHKTRQAG
ncbi:MAG: hypothetical protein AB7E49_01595 [Campylobacterales bacterium]